MVPTFVKLSGHQMGPTWKFHRKFTPEKVTQNPKGKDLSPNSQPSIFQGRGVKLRECIGVLPKFTALPCFSIKSREYWCFFTMFFNTFLGILGALP